MPIGPERRPGRPVVVKSIDGRELRDRKIDQLRESLASTVTMVQQLGIDKNEALSLFRGLLDESGKNDTDSEETP